MSGLGTARRLSQASANLSKNGARVAEAAAGPAASEGVPPEVPPRPGADETKKRAEYRRCGDKSCSTCREGRGHGPYLYAVWREGKKVKRKYLGKART